MTWQCPTYLSRKIAAGEDGREMSGAALLPERFSGANLCAQCPSCRQFVAAFRLVDLTAMSDADRAALGAGAYACDGCWNAWESRGKPLADGTPFAEDVMYARIGAPAEMTEKTAAILDLRDLERAERKKPGSFDRASFLNRNAAVAQRADDLVRRDRASRNAAREGEANGR